MSSVEHSRREEGPGSGSVRQGAKALAERNGKVLLVKERNSRGRPFWTLPGGGAKSGESLREALSRELAEELRCGVRIRERTGEMVYAHTGPRRTASVYAVFACDVGTGLTANRVHGILDLAWRPPGDFPPRTLPQVRAVVSGSWSSHGP